MASTKNRKQTFDLRRVLTSYCRQIIITIKHEIKKLNTKSENIGDRAINGVLLALRQRMRAVSEADICSSEISLVINHKAIIG